MQSTQQPTSVGRHGNGKPPFLEAWQLATLPVYKDAAGNIVNLEYALDSEFDVFVERSKIQVNKHGFAWNFFDKIAFVRWAVKQGIQLVLVAEPPNKIPNFSEYKILGLEQQQENKTDEP